MNINRNFMRQNITSLSIILFLIVFAFINYLKPNFLYSKDGTLREFGIGYTNKTVVPIWLIAIILSIFSYFSILYYLASPKMNFYNY